MSIDMIRHEPERSSSEPQQNSSNSPSQDIKAEQANYPFCTAKPVKRLSLNRALHFVNNRLFIITDHF
ncbi:hypothetical protein CEXT_455921 [Caerostris extrusa]|uniref:Uncharacterized protein n=1 Tax=Caerostris extrusa TaxID=172846 RepID=A0AAV4RE67_CAEEX|nr:hypothetical protein CEXT_455921 [Caerostris extrusa]